MPSSTKKDKSRTFMVGSSDSETDNEDLALIHLVLRKLTIKDQTLLHRHFEKIPDAFSSLWRDQHERLDLGQMQWKLHGSNLLMFLQDMCTEFRSVHLRSEQLQEELNILEQAGIERLVHVTDCEISWNHSLSNRNKNIPQWPFHALPKLLSNLIHLEIFASVQACFIDRFKKLESLKIYEEISSPALEAILSSDMPLMQLHLLGNPSHQLLGISNCKLLRNLLVNLQTFISNSSDIFQLPELLVLRLTQLEELELKATVKALSRVIQQKGSQLKSFQLNCNFMAHAKYLTQMKLNHCLCLDELELVDCKFENQDMSKLCLPVSQSYTMFCYCPDLIDDQLLDFVKASPNLKELVLIECPNLTEGLLHNVVKVRRSGKKQTPLLIRVKDCQNIWDSYKRNLASLWTRKRSVVKLECITEDYEPIDNVQFIFHESQHSPNIL
ncbi:uncharacterized protein LOC128257456 [Drosophila gunungcola]|uniref:uncharacterized protein LOC128257456 n=1 Tax=Drosophila gunungcola TaxID=103775 RepID=UPI0022E34121|nr:uncharacterized protein LOC128257456 [Drosophila gunungcola]